MGRGETTAPAAVSVAGLCRGSNRPLSSVAYSIIGSTRFVSNVAWLGGSEQANDLLSDCDPDDGDALPSVAIVRCRWPLRGRTSRHPDVEVAQTTPGAST